MKYKYTIIIPMLFLACTLSGQSDCDKVISSREDPGPAQFTGTTLPSYAKDLEWFFPAKYTRTGGFSGVAGNKASHEGVDYIHDDSTVPQVNVLAASSGTVVYVREGCPESSVFSHNNSNRECGAGWGNHVVVKHGSNVYTRYAHLTNNSAHVKVGDVVEGGNIIAAMGNSGRSEVRHLHFELGTFYGDFDACGMSQNFDYVFNPNQLQYKTKTAVDDDIKEESLKIYKQSDSGNIVVKIPNGKSGHVRINIYDLKGCKLYEENLLNQSDEIVIKSDFKKGFLLCKIQTSKSVLLHKFLN